MTRKYFLLPLILCLFPLVIPAMSCTGSQAERSVPEKRQAKQQAEFQLSPITVSPKWLFIGDNATVSANVTNIGAVDGTYVAVFTIDGQKAGEKDIQLAQGKSSEVSFPITSASQNDKAVAIGDSKAVVSFYTSKPYNIQYDDYFNQAGTSWGLGNTWIANESWGQIVRFTVPAKPFRISKISIGATASLKCTDQKFTINIWDNTRKKIWTSDFPWKIFMGQWPTLADFDVPNIVVDNDFLWK